jgi:competence protein ComFC
LYRCLLCRGSGTTAHPFSPSAKRIPVCLSCQHQIRLNLPPSCRKCSHPIDADGHPDILCRRCLHSPLFFDRAWSVCLYNDTARRLLHWYKFGRKTGLRHLYLHLVISFLELHPAAIEDMDWIIPVPLHSVRQRERGFNQSELIARMISRELGLSFCLQHLVRARPTKNQAMISPKDRWTNIRGAFTINRSQLFEGKNVMLLDDLYTTGATSSEAARVLKDAGAEKVHVLALNIAVSP